MELQDASLGYSGITQESQLLFSTFQSLSTIQCDGLIVNQQPTLLKPLVKSLLNKNQPIKLFSDFIIQYKNSLLDAKNWPSHTEIALLALRLFFLGSSGFLWPAIKPMSINTKGFETFLWETFFASGIDSSQFEKVTTAAFRILKQPLTLLNILGNYTPHYPRLDTKEYAIFLTQSPFPAKVAAKTLHVVRYHDAVPIFAPQFIEHPKFHQKFHYNALKKNSKKAIFVCSSEATRQDLLRLFPILEKRSHVIHDAVANHYFVETKSQHKLHDIIRARIVNSNYLAANDLAGKTTSFAYLLMVSTIEPRKNHLRLIEAWERVRGLLKKDLKLILVGNIGWDEKRILNAMKPWQQKGALFHLHHVPPSELRYLFNHASCVVCPSLYEGFDISGIEAMLCGAKVAASNIAVHREVYRDFAIYFNPFSVDEQANVIAKIILAKDEGLNKKGLKWAQRYLPEAIVPQWEDFLMLVKNCQTRINY
ncbi:MAG: hypothetical protein A3F18_03810 [Legionellales bacterium RIFCSPHIGHO2_12_FULL_37_14]|nr:MAG: hypothetical protein A3F18_03810 [Legionellales bacterium RIFCSPHIGHO2_12_FULL_37_14]